MRQFLHSNQAFYQSLEQRAAGGQCQRFFGEELPPGCQPLRGCIGIEVKPGGPALLFVQLGVQYSGPDPEIRRWLENGEIAFDSFDGLRRWLQGPLREAYAASQPTPRREQTICPLPAGNLTDMEKVSEAISKLPRARLVDENALFRDLSARVIGQDPALRSLVEGTARHCARIDPKCPSVMFAIGPSGVGKTRTAEALAEVLNGLLETGAGYQFLRLDMAEYQESHRVSQLLGAPQGYVGHGEGSQLLDTLAANPRTIVLFDEIEKAHPSILRVLMNAMDAGRLSSASRTEGGREIDCRFSIFVFTSNLEAGAILKDLDTVRAHGNVAQENEVCRRRLMAAGVATEIVGRIRRFLVFRRLDDEARSRIAQLSVVEAAAEYGLQVEQIAPELIVSLMTMRGSEDFGVRPERFLIEELLGKAFMEAVNANLSGAVRIVGPPFACEPAHSGKPALN